METIKALVLSGGGGRGAFHAGVYKYLMEQGKAGVDASHADAWDPQVIVGTSIGAVNGAAIAGGLSAEELVAVWSKLEEEDIQGLPPGMRGMARWLSHKIFGEIMDTNLPQVKPEDATSPMPDHFWSPFPLLPEWMGEKLIGRWINLLDTGPLRKTLHTRFKFDVDRVAQSNKTLLIAATNVQTGERVMFSNHEVRTRMDDADSVVTGITANRIIASCSIPLVYPWTRDEETNAYYWDGAVVANTPLGAALDVVADVPTDVPAEVVVVLMTPWWEKTDKVRRMPDSFGEAVTWTLDWALLASFRERLRLIETYNHLAAQERAEGKGPYRYREVKVIIVAPEDFMDAARIIDYDGDVSEGLIEMGYDAAKKAFAKHFGG